MKTPCDGMDGWSPQQLLHLVLEKRLILLHRISSLISLALGWTWQGGKSRKSKRSRQSDGSSKGELSSTAASECSDSRMIDSSFSTSSLSLDSSLCSSLSSSSRSYDYGQNQKPSQSISLEPSQKKRSLKEKRSWSGYGLFALCITILVVVLWGKICAILCTSTWLYVTSQRSIAYTPENNVCDPTDSAEYKKRIVLGGFLDRNRSQFVACP